MESARPSEQFIIDAYATYRIPLINYIAKKTGNHEIAEDLTQDVYMRVLESRRMICPQKIKYLLFIIARNLITDYFRHSSRKIEADAFLSYSLPPSSNETEETILANDLLHLEQRKVSTFSKQQKRVYIMIRYEHKSPVEVAQQLNLKIRTVENHLFSGRKEIRTFIRKCI